MFDDLASLFYHQVVTAFNEYNAERKRGTIGRSSDLRLAVNAASALYHFREHLPATSRPSKRELSGRCPDYKLLGDAANASKHGAIDRDSPQLTSAENIVEELVLTKYQDTTGAYWHAEKVVLLHLNDGTTRELHDVMRNVFNLWVDELHARGILPKLSAVAPDEFVVPVRSSDDGTSQIAAEIVQGLRFRQHVRLQEFNHETGVIQPIDLTGAQVRMRIYRPGYEVDVSLRHESTGKELTRTIELTPEESADLGRMTTDAERSEFINFIASNRGVHNEMFAELEGVDEGRADQ